MTPEQREADRKSIREATILITREQVERAINIIRNLADSDCNFASSRAWKNKKCGDDNGRGFDCDKCRGRDLLYELGVKNITELTALRQTNR